jgi:hypothetical protein
VIKKNLPFAVFLVVLIVLPALFDGGSLLLNKSFALRRMFGLDNVNIFFLAQIPVLVSIVQFILCGPLLLIVLIWEWGAERLLYFRRAPLSEITLSSGQNYLTLSIYILALVLTILPVIVTERFFSTYLSHYGPYFRYNFTSTLYLLSLATCMVIILPLTIFALLKRNVSKMGQSNSIAEMPKGGIVLLSWIRQYKFFLWRLWPVWLANSFAAWFIVKLYRMIRYW